MAIDLKSIMKGLDRRYGMTCRRFKRRSRQSILLCFIGAFVVFYLLSKWLPRREVYQNIQYDACLQHRLEQFARDQVEMNTIFNHEPIQYGEIVSLPFTGNGYLGLSLSSQSQIQLLTDIRSPFTSSGYSPVVRISSDTWEDSSATIVQMKEGVVRRIQCFKFSKERSAHVTHVLYAHRKRPSLIVQDIDIINPSEHTLDLALKQNNQILNNDLKQLDQQDVQFDQTKDSYIMTTNQIPVRQHGFIIYVILTNRIISTTNVKPGSLEKQTILTVVKFSSVLLENSLLNKTYVQELQQELQTQAKSDMSDALSISAIRLLKEHTSTWSLIWESGFSISRSLAPSTMNGDIVNRTIYYVLCSTSAPLYELKVDENKTAEFTHSLFQVNQCYESHSTLIGAKLWIAPGDDLAVSQLANLWRSTLSRKGCFTLMRSGVNGVLQSMLLSIGGIRFRNHHLEMYLDPKELHRDMFFRSINFGKQYHVNISITVGHDNRAVIDVSMDSENAQAYACDAGCLDSPTKLGILPVRFPVKMTSPPTAILYIAEDFEYMTQLKDTLHVKEVEIAPPHAHDVLALHRHGHKLGGLPIIFWIALAFLIIIFHLFLVKIILNEMGVFTHKLPTYTRARVL
ncbi:unnamed protein product [Rotaria socialis]|uniref:Uncharacterized protein n=2 Tax=Rotaria socialis TaxID=392032 RepID=A0A817X4U8_9BILA|nr:unnamed protein product [Rotaria socialis]CAF3363623.1 unnamed protein product [Rotaria socialis]CAF4339172.1 unnamed protein product [Rotaria socialis]